MKAQRHTKSIKSEDWPQEKPKARQSNKSLGKRGHSTLIASSSPTKPRKEVPQLKPIQEKIKKRDQKKNPITDSKDKKKKTNYNLNLKELKPVNLEQEKHIFFERGGNYEPFFLYPTISDLSDEQIKNIGLYEAPDESCMKLAMTVLEAGCKINFSSLLRTGVELTQAQTIQAFDAYINQLGISELLTYQFVENTIASTSVVHNNVEGVSKVLIGLPIRYRNQTIGGILNHQIGTHFLRKYNDKYQKWHKERAKNSLGPYLQTEQGLAALNQSISYIRQGKIPPLLYRPAMLYYGCYMASKLPFSRLYEQLSRFEPDPEIRWRQCVRVKRGMADTAKLCGMYKDQIYFRGAIEVLQNRNKLNFVALHCGKINVEDCLKLTEKGQIYLGDKVKLPLFLSDLGAYKQVLDLIAAHNQIDSHWKSP